MTFGQVDDELEEMPVADDDVLRASAVDVAALAREGEDGWIDEQLFIPVGIRRRAEQDGGALPRRERSLSIEGDVANVAGESEDLIQCLLGAGGCGFKHGRSPLPRLQDRGPHAGGRRFRGYRW